MGGQVINCSNVVEYEKYKSNKDKLLLFFTAPWSGPAQKLSTTVKDLAEENPDVEVLQLDMRYFQSVASKMGVESAPAFLFIKDNKVQAKLHAARPAELYDTISNLK